MIGLFVESGALVSVSQVEVRAATAPAAPDSARPGWWRRLALSSFVVAGVTVLILWVAVVALLRQGSLGNVLSAGRAELAAPALIALIIVVGICEQFWPAERRRVLARGHVQDACF